MRLKHFASRWTPFANGQSVFISYRFLGKLFVKNNPLKNNDPEKKLEFFLSWRFLLY
jgi:hypothetical protein